MIYADIDPDDSPLDELTLLAQAERATRLSDWGQDVSFLIGLRILVQSLQQMAPTPEFRHIAHARLQHLLRTRLHLQADGKQHPEILAARIQRPLIVIGLPRTGTTVTYDLLARDPAARTPREWEAFSPWPAPRADTFHSDPRIAALRARYDALLARAPQLATMQRFDPTQPGECNHIMMFHFAGPNFVTELTVPGHTRWITEERAPGLYRTHERVLQQLQWHGPRGRWTLKSPAHLFDLEGLLETYPDACLVWTHRDPLATFSSLSSMSISMRTAFGAPVDKATRGAEVASLWGAALTRAVASRRNPNVERRVFDVAHRDVIADPKGTIERIHRHFDIPFTPQHGAAIDTFVRDSSAAKRLGQHRHDPADFGLERAAIRRQLSDYYGRFEGLLAY